MTSGSDSPLPSLRAASALLLAALVLLRPDVAGADSTDALTRTAARELAVEGAQSFEQRDYRNALDRFRRAFAVFPAPSIAIMEARSLVGLGRFVEALDKYEETLRTPLADDAPDAFRQAVADAAREAEELKPRIPRLTLDIDAETRALPGFDLMLDGKRIRGALWGVPLPVDPGEHTVRASATARAPVLRRVALAEAARELVRVDFAASVPSAAVTETATASASPGSSSRVLGWTAVGVAGLGLGTSAITGVIALGKKSELDDACRPTCPASAKDDIDSWRTQRTISYVSLGVGAAALAVGGYLLLGSDDDATQVGALVTPTGASLRGEF